MASIPAKLIFSSLSEFPKIDIERFFSAISSPSIPGSEPKSEPELVRIKVFIFRLLIDKGLESVRNLNLADFSLSSISK